jgi:hypothetical protein
VKTSPTSGPVWFAFISFLVKLGTVAVFFGIQAYYYFDVSRYRDWTAGDEQHNQYACPAPGIFGMRASVT